MADRSDCAPLYFTLVRSICDIGWLGLFRARLIGFGCDSPHWALGSTSTAEHFVARTRQIATHTT